LASGVALVSCLIERQNVRAAEGVARRAVRYWTKTINNPSDPFVLESKNRLCTPLERLQDTELWRHDELLFEMENICRDVLANSNWLKEASRPRYDGYQYELSQTLLLMDDESKKAEGRRISEELIARAKKDPNAHIQWDLRILQGLSAWTDRIEDKDLLTQKYLSAMEIRYGKDDPKAMQAILERASALLRLKQIDEAETNALRCYRHIQNSPPRDKMAMETYTIMADVYQEKGEYKKAANYRAEALWNLQSMPNNDRILYSFDGLRILEGLGRNLRQAGDYDEAETACLLRVDICRSIKDPSRLLPALRDCGLTFSAASKPEVAIEYYDEAISQFFNAPERHRSPSPELGAEEESADTDDTSLSPKGFELITLSNSVSPDSEVNERKAMTRQLGGRYGMDLIVDKASNPS
jgi:tetratricopeptide (TPR) repeat protein